MIRPIRKAILVTGGAGFIGSNFIRYVFNRPEFQGKIINLDSLTYAGRRENLSDIEQKFLDSRYFFEQASIIDDRKVSSLIATHNIDTIVHFAAESHVDRSIFGPKAFIETNIMGTFQLLEASRAHFEKNKDLIFYHVSTDEVYGSLGSEGKFTETTPYDPRSPYSASKAASDHLVRAHFHTFGLPVLISNCSNNYGPHQHLEKMIPLMLTRMLEGQPLPIYGDGQNVRDWLFVEDHCEAIWRVLHQGVIGATYNIGGDCEINNLNLVHLLCDLLAKATNRNAKEFKDLISFVRDRPGHDRRYAIDFSKINRDLGWQPQHTIEQGLTKTIDWYLNESNWLNVAEGKAFSGWLKKAYSKNFKLK